MTDAAKKNGASPVKPTYQRTPNYLTPIDGLAKRELFAAMAMQELLANPKTFDAPEVSAAHDAVMMADALLLALEKGQ